MRTIPQYLFSATTLCLALGATMHTAGFPRPASVIDAAHSLALFGAMQKGLWLCNSVNVVAFALLFGCAAMRPSMVPRPLVLLFTAMLFVLAGLVYATVGSFVGGHLLTAAGPAAALGCIIQMDQHLGAPRRGVKAETAHGHTVVTDGRHVSDIDESGMAETVR